VPARIPRLVAPPVGDHRARIAVPEGRARPGGNRAAVREGAHASQILVISNVAKPRDGAERRIDRSKPDGRPASRGPRTNNTGARDSKSYGSVRLGAMTATTEILAVPNGAPDRVAPARRTGPRPIDAARRPRSGRYTARVRRVRALTSKIRRRRARTPNDRRPSHRSARVQRAPTGASTSTP